MNILNFVLEKIGYVIKRKKNYDLLLESSREINDLLELILSKNGGGKCKAQLRQDIFALAMTGFKRDGYFVEFGATDGVGLSNTYLLEKDYGWTGILAEPAKRWHDELIQNRAANLSFDCVWSVSGAELDFSEVESGVLSTVTSFVDSDRHAKSRRKRTAYKVQSISLLDLLEKFDAPKFIDYISIDTEGSELDILNSFDFDRYTFGVITVEHNYTENREEIYSLLSRHGYRRVLSHISRFDDWYVLDR